MSAITPGRWRWWTSNSWRRLRSHLPDHSDVNVLEPYKCLSDGHPDCAVSEADMRLIRAAPEMLKALLLVQRNVGQLMAEVWNTVFRTIDLATVIESDAP